jgi:hypothetical protein
MVDSYLCKEVEGLYRIGYQIGTLVCGLWFHRQLSHKVFPMDGALVGAESHYFISGWLRFRLLSLSCHVTILQG